MIQLGAYLQKPVERGPSFAVIAPGPFLTCHSLPASCCNLEWSNVKINNINSQRPTQRYHKDDGQKKPSQSKISALGVVGPVLVLVIEHDQNAWNTVTIKTHGTRPKRVAQVGGDTFHIIHNPSKSSVPVLSCSWSNETGSG